MTRRGWRKRLAALLALLGLYFLLSPALKPKQAPDTGGTGLKESNPGSKTTMVLDKTIMMPWEDDLIKPEEIQDKGGNSKRDHSKKARRRDPASRDQVGEEEKAGLDSLRHWIDAAKRLRELEAEVEELERKMARVKNFILANQRKDNNSCYREAQDVDDMEFTPLDKELFIFSSFLDLRLKKAHVRVLALLGKKAMAATRFYCHMNGVGSIQAQVYELCENHNKPFGGYMLSCPLPDHFDSPSTRQVNHSSSRPNIKRHQSAVDKQFSNSLHNASTSLRYSHHRSDSRKGTSLNESERHPTISKSRSGTAKRNASGDESKANNRVSKTGDLERDGMNRPCPVKLSLFPSPSEGDVQLSLVVIPPSEADGSAEEDVNWMLHGNIGTATPTKGQVIPQGLVPQMQMRDIIKDFDAKHMQKMQIYQASNRTRSKPVPKAVNPTKTNQPEWTNRRPKINGRLPDGSLPRGHLGDENSTNDSGKSPWFLAEEDVPYRYAVCVPPLFGYLNASALVEFMELSFLLGADHVILYVLHVTEGAMQALQHYRAQGQVTVVPWRLPKVASATDKLWYWGQLLAHNDCLYRAMPLARMLVLHDVDEVLVPHAPGATLWDHVMPGLLGRRHAGLSFKSAFFDPRRAVPHPSGLTSAGSLARTTRFSSVRTKVMVAPRRVFEVGIHHISRTLADRWTVFSVNESVAYIHHYRTCMADFGMRCKDFVKDSAMLRYFDKLAVNFRSVLDAIGEKWP